MSFLMPEGWRCTFFSFQILRLQVAAKARPGPWGQSATNHWPMQECKGLASAFLLARMELSPWGHPKGHPSPELPVVSAEVLVATTLGWASPSSQTCPVIYLQLYLSRALPNKPADSFPSQSLLSGNPDRESGFQKWSWEVGVGFGEESFASQLSVKTPALV